MSSICDILQKTIFGKDNFCSLCFRVFEKDSLQFNLKHEIHIEDNSICFIELLNYIFRKNVQEDMCFNNKICIACRKMAINCYKFMKICKENSKTLRNSIDSITDSLNNVIEDIDSYETLFIKIDTQDFRSQQYYDYKQNFYNKSLATKGLESIINMKSKTEVGNVLGINDDLFMEYEDFDEMPQEHKTRKKRIDNKDIPEISTSDLRYIGHNATPFQCKLCLKHCRNEKVLRRHYFKTHYPKKFKCSKCTQIFISKGILKQHELEYHDNKICLQCGKRFKNKYNLAKHESIHNDSVICQDCGKVYRSKDAFGHHIVENKCRQKIRKSADQATFFCDYCNKKFCHKPYLAKHIKFEHENAEGYKCKFCNKKFYTPSNLESHVVKHTLEKKYQCKLCERKFVSKMSLTYHTRLHTGETPYSCNFCEKSFLSASRRLDHMRRNHLVPSLECEICHSMFKTTGNLLKHKKRHSNPNSRLNKTYNIQECVIHH